MKKTRLAYSPAGFIWDAALKHGKTLRNYGEFMEPAVRWRDKAKKGTPDFLTCYRAWKQGTDEVIFESLPSVESMQPFSPTTYVGWEMSVPDQFRADFILKELAEYEKKGEFPQPGDHLLAARSHERDVAGLPYAGGMHGRQRPGFRSSC